MQKLPKQVSTSLINALAAGVVPRVGLEHIAVGREKEIAALAQDLENIGEGGAAFRFVIGRYGSGKSFLLQLIRNQAMEQGFVVADADLSPERRLAGSKNHAVATYRELMGNIATRTNPNGGAIECDRTKSYQIRVNFPFFGADKAPRLQGIRHKKEKASGKKGVIKADLVSALYRTLSLTSA